MLTHQKKERFFLFTFHIWIIISSLYFLRELLEGDISSLREKSIFFQALKYIICLLFSIFFISHQRKTSTKQALIYIIFLSLIFFFLIQVFYEPINPRILSVILVIACMLGLSCTLTVFTEEQKKALHTVIISTGIIVSLLSLYEFFFMADIFASRWNSIESVRLVSSLLNPNNMGCYIGACLIITLSYPASVKSKSLCVCILLFPFAMSGSRTAWLAFTIILFFRYCIPQLRKKIFYAFLLATIIPTFLALANLAFNLPSDMQDNSTHRYLDYSSGKTRLKRNIEYLSNIDTSYLLPDSSESRTSLTEESGFLTLINSLGFINAFALFFFILCVFSINIKRGVWLDILIYYFIASFSINTINSFPNNQMLFISLGSILSVRMIYSNRKVRDETHEK